MHWLTSLTLARLARKWGSWVLVFWPWTYRVSLKKLCIVILSHVCSKSPIWLFHMWFGIRILCLFYLNIQTISIMNINCPKNAIYCLHGHTIFSDQISHSITVILILLYLKCKQLSAETYTSILIHSKEHHTKWNIHGAVLNNTDCVWTGNANTEQINLHFRIWIWI